ncbi:MAG: hypothetical protein IPN44_07810 [Flavobacteriales bacterium]|nr:hypothetical protein [Flavobacteriales bacterium]
MKRSLLLLRLCGLLFLCSSASVAEAKECVGALFVFLKQADGTLVEIQSNDPNTLDYPEYSATLSKNGAVA